MHFEKAKEDHFDITMSHETQRKVEAEITTTDDALPLMPEDFNSFVALISLYIFSKV